MPPGAKQCQIPEHAKILVVEDEALIALDVETMLVEGGAAEVIVATSLKAATDELMRRTDINLLLADVDLRDGSGLDLVPAARSRNIPVILTTGFAQKTIEGVPQLQKPYSQEELVVLIAEIMKRSR